MKSSEEVLLVVHRPYLIVFPCRDLLVEDVPGAFCAHHLSVPLQDVGGHKLPTCHGTGRQLIPHQCHGVLAGQGGGVVSDEGDAVALGVVAPGVGPLPLPPTALVDVSIRAGHEASGTQQVCETAVDELVVLSCAAYLYPMSSQPLVCWWKRCMERMSAEHCSKVRQGWLGLAVWWMNR